jgi:hypothetical protein
MTVISFKDWPQVNVLIMTTPRVPLDFTGKLWNLNQILELSEKRSRNKY